MRRALLLLIAAACAALALAAAAPAAPGPHARKPPARTLTATIDASAPGRPIPASFLGLSFEAKALPQLAHYGDEGNMVQLMRSLGPGVIRFGGVTVDTQVAWSPNGDSKPSWATTVVTRNDLAGIARLAAESHWGVLL